MKLKACTLYIDVLYTHMHVHSMHACSYRADVLHVHADIQYSMHDWLSSIHFDIGEVYYIYSYSYKTPVCV